MSVSPQITIDEQVLDDTGLEAALEAREQAREVRAAAVKAFGEADEDVRTIISGLDLDDDVTFRCGRFVIRETQVDGRSVAFETEPTQRLSIRIAEATS